MPRRGVRQVNKLEPALTEHLVAVLIWDHYASVMIIRRAFHSDIPELVRLRLAAVSEANNGFTPSNAFAESTHEYLSTHLSQKRSVFCWIAEAEHSIVSTASIIVFPRMPGLGNMSGREGYISNVYTEAAYRRRGLAASLLKAVVDDSKLMQLGRLWLYPNENSERLYEKFGFQTKLREHPEMQLVL